VAFRFASLRESISELVHDGDTIAMEGFTHLIPFAAGHELIRQGRTDLTLIRMTPDILYDQLIGAGAVRALVFSWGGNPGVGSLHRLRDAVEHGWPRPLALAEYSHAMMAAAYVAGASGLPFGMLRAGTGTSLPVHNPGIRSITCPFTGEVLTAVPAHRPDVAVIHAQRADRSGNVQLWGIVGVQKEAVYCAQRALVTVEEIVDALDPVPGGVILPADTIAAIAVVPSGAAPSYAQGYYRRDNASYIAWDAVSRSRDRFGEWVRELRAT
jgi:glutaconate CoA-transferase, subunit A